MRQNFEHPRAAQSRNVSGVSRAKRDRRKDFVARQITPACNRKPVEVDTEDEYEQGTEQEGGHTDAYHREPHRDVVLPSIGFECRENARQNTNEQRETQRVQAKLGRNGKAAAQNLVHAAPWVFEGWAEVTVTQITEVGEVLLVQW